MGSVLQGRCPSCLPRRPAALPLPHPGQPPAARPLGPPTASLIMQTSCMFRPAAGGHRSAGRATTCADHAKVVHGTRCRGIGAVVSGGQRAALTCRSCAVHAGAVGAAQCAATRGRRSMHPPQRRPSSHADLQECARRALCTRIRWALVPRVGPLVMDLEAPPVFPLGRWMCRTRTGPSQPREAAQWPARQRMRMPLPADDEASPAWPETVSTARTGRAATA